VRVKRPHRPRCGRADPAVRGRGSRRTHALGCLIPFCSYHSLPFLSRPRLANPTDTSESKTTLQGKASRQNIRYFFYRLIPRSWMHIPMLVCCLQSDDAIELARLQCPKPVVATGNGDGDDMDRDSFSFSSTVAQADQAQRLSLVATASDTRVPQR